MRFQKKICMCHFLLGSNRTINKHCFSQRRWQQTIFLQTVTIAFWLPPPLRQLLASNKVWSYSLLFICFFLSECFISYALLKKFQEFFETNWQVQKISTYDLHYNMIKCKRQVQIILKDSNRTTLNIHALLNYLFAHSVLELLQMPQHQQQV